MDEERQNHPEGERTPPPPPIPAAVATMEPEPLPKKTSGLAIASLVLAILGIFTCVTAPIALILGIIALVQTGRDPRLRGMGMAVAAVIISGLAVLIVPILAAIMFPVFVRARESAKQTVCLNNVRQLGAAMQMYTADYNNHFPPADRWNESLQPYFRNPKVLICPVVKGGRPSYGMNERIGGLRVGDIVSPARTVSLFDSFPGPDKFGGSELLPSPPRHPRGNNFGFIDGHAQAIQDADVLNWDPGVSAPAVPGESEPAPSG